MAKFGVIMPDDMYNQAMKAASPENICRAIDGAAPILTGKMKSEIRSAIKGEGKELADSIQATKAKKCKNGAYIAAVYPKGKSSRPRYPNGSSKERTPPVSNAMKAAILNYGKKGQPAKPWISKAVNGSRTAVEDALGKAFEENIDDN